MGLVNPGFTGLFPTPGPMADSTDRSGPLALKFLTQSQNSQHGVPESQYQLASVSPCMSPLLTVSCFLPSQALGMNVRRAPHWFILPPDRTVLNPTPKNQKRELNIRYPNESMWSKRGRLKTHQCETAVLYLMICSNPSLSFLSAGDIFN